MTVSTRFKYEGEVEKEGRTLDKITFQVLTVDFALEAGSPLPFTLKESALKPSETKGELLFDRAMPLLADLDGLGPLCFRIGTEGAG